MTDRGSIGFRRRRRTLPRRNRSLLLLLLLLLLALVVLLLMPLLVLLLRVPLLVLRLLHLRTLSRSTNRMRAVSSPLSLMIARSAIMMIMTMALMRSSQVQHIISSARLSGDRVGSLVVDCLSGMSHRVVVGWWRSASH